MVMQPLNFNNNVSSNTIFRLHKGTGDSGLLLRAPRDEIGTKKNSKLSVGVIAIRTSNPIKITECNHQIQPRVRLKEQAMICYSLQELENTLNNIHVSCAKRMHELGSHLYNTCNVRSSHDKIMQHSNHATIIRWIRK